MARYGDHPIRLGRRSQLGTATTPYAWGDDHPRLGHASHACTPKIITAWGRRPRCVGSSSSFDGASALPTWGDDHGSIGLSSYAGGAVITVRCSARVSSARFASYRGEGSDVGGMNTCYFDRLPTSCGRGETVVPGWCGRGTRVERGTNVRGVEGHRMDGHRNRETSRWAQAPLTRPGPTHQFTTTTSPPRSAIALVAASFAASYLKSIRRGVPPSSRHM